MNSQDIYKVDFAEAVQKATNRKVGPPKPKHVRRIVLESHNTRGCTGLFREISKRPLAESDVVAWKTLITFHKVFQEGPPKCLEDGYFQLQFFETLQSMWKHSSNTEFGPLVSEYAGFLVEKLALHHKHREFDGEFSIETYKKTPIPTTDSCYEAITHLLDHQTAIDKLQSSVFDSHPLNEAKLAVLIPLILESYAVYSLTTYLLQELVNFVDNQDMFSYLTERYYALYIRLRDFYFKASNIKYITSFIAVPLLPKDPPQFVPTGAKKHPTSPRTARRLMATDTASTKKRARSASPTRHSNLLPKPEPLPAHFVAGPQPPAAPLVAVSPSLAAQSGQSTPASLLAAFPPTGPSLFPTAPVTVAPPADPRARSPSGSKPPGWVTFGDGSGATDLFSMPATTATATAATSPTAAAPPTNAAVDPRLIRRPSTSSDAPRPATSGATTVGPSNPVVKKPYKFELPEKRDKQPTAAPTSPPPSSPGAASGSSGGDSELQRQLEAEREKNKKLLEELLMLRSAHQQLQAEHAELRRQFEDLLDHTEHARDKRRLRVVGGARDTLASHVIQLDSPAFMGNEGSAGPDVLDACRAVGDALTALLKSCKAGDEEDIEADVAALLRAHRELLANAKGAALRAANPALRQELLDAARNTARASLSLLDSVKDDPGNENALAPLGGVVRLHIGQVEDAVKKVEAVQAAEQEQRAASLDELSTAAERELLAAAKIIEEAAKQLLAVKSQPRPPRPPGEAMGVELTDAILEAALAITSAAAKLVQSATVCQRELVAQGKASPNSDSARYASNPMWSEGLVSAAQAVAAATGQLVRVANGAAQGELQEESLIAAARAVTAATAQLVAAATVKADPMSKTQASLNAAAKAVREASDLLVNAARQAAAKKAGDTAEETVDFTKANFGEAKAAIFKQQELILKLQKELDNARMSLAKMREAEYKAFKGKVHPMAAGAPPASS